MCVPAVSYICLCFFHCYYKSYNAMLKYKTVFNQLIKLREFSFNLEKIIYYFVTTVSAIQPHLGTFIMDHLLFVQKKQSE